MSRLGGERSVHTGARAGGHLPLHTTGVGKVLLAWQTPAAIEKYLSRPLERTTPYSIVDPVKLKKELDETRERGYALTRQESTAGNGSVAVPILRGGRAVDEVEGLPLDALEKHLHAVGVAGDARPPVVVTVAVRPHAFSSSWMSGTLTEDEV